MTPNQHPLLAGKIALVAADYIRKNVSFRMDSASSRSVMVIADPVSLSLSPSFPLLRRVSRGDRVEEHRLTFDRAVSSS